jgi:hypothetical protein
MHDVICAISLADQIWRFHAQAASGVDVWTVLLVDVSEGHLAHALYLVPYDRDAVSRVVKATRRITRPTSLDT